MTAQVAALFVDARGVYPTIPGVDCWDEKRDARKYDGSLPIIAHPPCSNWSNMAPVVQKRRGRIIGSDNGCFQSALWAVKTFGGVLEQPAHSRAWTTFGLAKPRGAGWLRTDTGWVCQVSQSAYGHRARKRTWLYYVGKNPPAELDWRDLKGEAVVSYCRRRGDGTIWNDDRPRLTKKQASATPRAFAEALIGLAVGSGGNE